MDKGQASRVEAIYKWRLTDQASEVSMWRVDHPDRQSLVNLFQKLGVGLVEHERVV